MKKGITYASASLLGLLGLASCAQAPEPDVAVADATSPTSVPSTAAAYEGLIYARVTTDDGAVREGRLRWGGDEEALWSNYFNGFKDENPWVAHAPKERRSIEIFGFEISGREREPDLRRPFMVRFGDIERIDPRGRDLFVTLKSGTRFHLDRFSADDLADGLRVWDAEGNAVDIGEWQIESIEMLPTPRLDEPPSVLYGTVWTPQAVFTGLIQWNRQDVLGLDLLEGLDDGGQEIGVRFDDVGSIVRDSRDRSLVTTLDGRDIVLSGTAEVGEGNRGIYVDDSRYGRVLVSWDAFERVEFARGATSPAYSDFAAGRLLTGTVHTRAGSQLTGRLVYDLDESETTETLDAPAGGVDYTIPFSLVASIVIPDTEGRGVKHAMVTLRSGEELRLEAAGDLGETNAGMLVFVEGAQSPEFVAWAEVERIEFDGP